MLRLGIDRSARGKRTGETTYPPNGNMVVETLNRLNLERGSAIVVGSAAVALHGLWGSLDGQVEPGGKTARDIDLVVDEEHIASLLEHWVGSGGSGLLEVNRDPRIDHNRLYIPDVAGVGVYQLPMSVDINPLPTDRYTEHLAASTSLPGLSTLVLGVSALARRYAGHPHEGRSKKINDRRLANALVNPKNPS